jgi:hypothetical protein
MLVTQIAGLRPLPGSFGKKAVASVHWLVASWIGFVLQTAAARRNWVRFAKGSGQCPVAGGQLDWVRFAPAAAGSNWVRFAKSSGRCPVAGRQLDWVRFVLSAVVLVGSELPFGGHGSSLP